MVAGVASLVRPGLRLVQSTGREAGSPLVGRRYRAQERAWALGADLTLAATSAGVAPATMAQTLARAFREEPGLRTEGNARRFSEALAGFV